MNSHRQLCKITAQWLLSQPWCDLVSWEIKYKRGVLDSIGISKYSSKKHRVTVVEVKRTRADLLQDLNAKKMLKYENGSTHCYLAVTKECFLTSTKKERLSELQSLGLPPKWGVLLLPTSGNSKPKVLKTARSHSKVRKTTIIALTRKIARSYCYRVINNVF